MIFKVTEEMITEQICEYLSRIKGSQLNRIAPSGFFKNGRMVKHKSKFIKKGVSDIQFLHKGKFFVFEVKTPIEHKFVKKHISEIMERPSFMLSKKKQHLKDQASYIQSVIINGGHGNFVSSLADVKKVIERA